jgi:precorrin-6Y C5,15-methyltransferase (decarboxylating)
MQLAFGRAGVPWQDAALASVHGRALRPTLLPLLGQPVIGLFTQDGGTPAAVARFFAQYGPTNYEAIVGENLGASDERVTRWRDLGELQQQVFSPLNYLVLARGPGLATETARQNRALVPGVPDAAFARPADGPDVMTRQEARAVILAKLLGPTDAGDTAWDIGAGLGTVAVELAVLRPHLEVLAVERDPRRLDLLRQNRYRFGAYNIRVVEGAAPDALRDESERPRLVFIGGSGGRLGDILDFVAERLCDGGRMVASFVTLEHLALALERLRRWQWPYHVTELHVARSDTLAGLTGLKPQRGVFLLSSDKPEGRS